jgi:hypothetical protein
VTKLDKEGKFLLASALSAIFKVNQIKKKSGLSNVPLYPPTKFRSNIFSRF